MINWGYKIKPKRIKASLTEIGIYVRDLDNGNELMHWHGKYYGDIFPGHSTITKDMVRKKLEINKQEVDKECIEYSKQVGCEYLGTEFVDCHNTSKRFDTIDEYINYLN